MPDIQGKNLSEEQKKQREEIAIFIEKATKRNISSLISEHFPKNKGTYYDNVVKIPLKLKFIDIIKEKFGVDLSDFLRTNTKIEESSESIKKENEALKRENELLREMIEMYKSRK
jgi:hypothetical protein